jgi:carboxyl-terminal processing protease
MKKNFKVLFLAVFVSVASCSFTTKEFNDPNKDKLLLDLITYVIQKGHYDPKDINDEFSIGVYEDFIKGLDPLKRYFLASDIAEFSKYRTEIDDQIKNKDLSFFDLVYGRFQERMEDVKKIYPEVLNKPFDFTETETIDVDYDNLAYANSIKQLKSRWKQQLKFTTLAGYYDLVEDQNNKEKGITDSEKKQ